MATLHGQREADERIRVYLKNPTSRAFLLHGPTGTGKTMAAHSLADSLHVDRSPNGGFHEIASGEQTAEAVRALAESFRSNPMVGKWRCVIVNQCDYMRSQIETMWLDILDRLPPHVVIVFTTSYPEKLSKAFTDRCEQIPFVASAKLVRQFVQEEWARRMPERAAPISLKNAGFREGCLPSYRLAIRDVEYAIEQIDEPEMGDYRLWIVHNDWHVLRTFDSWREEDARGFLTVLASEGFSQVSLSRTAESVKDYNPIPADAQRSKPRSG
jgi:ATPase family associated with various cellular activities (AAA)